MVKKVDVKEAIALFGIITVNILSPSHFAAGSKSSTQFSSVGGIDMSTGGLANVSIGFFNEVRSIHNGGNTLINAVNPIKK
jgi:hypothetical protein